MMGKTSVTDSQSSQTALPAQLDPRKVFRHGFEVEGNIAVSSLPRLRKLLLDDQGRVHASLSFGIDEERRHRVQGQVQAEVNVICQRCMQSMVQSLQDSVDLAVVNSEARMKQLPSNIDPWFCGEDDMLMLAEIVEEQLMLAMPIVTMHDNCVDIGEQVRNTELKETSGEDSSGSDKRNPFAVLAGLKSDSSKH